MKIKICGLKHPENIIEVIALKPDMVGFIFYKKSVRYAGETLTLKLLNHIPKSIAKVGVFVNEPIEIITDMIEKYKFDLVQLHGDEKPDYCEAVRNKVPTIKAFGVHNLFDFTLCKDYISVTDLFLFDTHSSLHGGSGKMFNHHILKVYPFQTPFIISGGIDLQRAKQLLQNPIHPKCIGIDVNSRFELPNQQKNVTQLKHLFKNQV